MAQSENTNVTEEEADLKLKEKEDHVANTTERYRNTNLLTIILLMVSVVVMVVNVFTLPKRPQDAGQWRTDLHLAALAISSLCLVGLCYANRPSFSCPYCGKHVGTNDDWMCGYCDTVNRPNWLGYRNHMLAGCGKCKHQAKSMICHHCKSCVCLSKAWDDRHPAQRVLKTASTPAPVIPQLRKAPVAPVIVVVDPVKEQLETLKREKQRIEHETEITNARIALATAESRYMQVKGASENRFKDVISRMLQPLEDKRQRREALMAYGQNTLQAIDARNDLNDEQKAKLRDELSIDMEQAALEDA